LGNSLKLGCFLGKKMNISEPQVLLEKITALREKLEKAVASQLYKIYLVEKALIFLQEETD